MIIIRPLGVVAALLALPFCRPTRVLPRGQHAGAPSEAYRQLHNVIVQSRGEYTGELAPRLNIPAKKQHPRAEAPHSSPAAAKRALLGVRQTCDAGYGYCYASGRCCPNANGNGQCCDDGTCVTSDEACCLYGGSCSSSEQCCTDGCAPKDTECCTNGHYCDSGYFCCGNGKCAPNGGECCADAEESVCPSGKHCVIFDGQQACCEDLSCSEYSGSGSGSSGNNNNDNYGGSGSAYKSYYPTYVPSITVPSFTPISSFTAIPTYSEPTLSVPSIPTAAGITSFSLPTFRAADYSTGKLTYFSTVITWYYYYVFITTTIFIQTESTFVTSTEATATTTLTAQATDSLEAALVFDTLLLSVFDAQPTAVTASGVSDFSQTMSTPSPTRQGGGPVAATGAPEGVSGQASGAEKMQREWGLWVWAACGICVGWGMILL